MAHDFMNADAVCELTVEKLVYGGEGLARREGEVVLVGFALPQERLRVRVAERRKQVARAAAPLEILSASPWRVAPGCPHFMRCGGCHYQHAAYEYQIEQKRAILLDALRRTAKLDYAGPLEMVAAEPWGYRNRVQLRIEEGAVGYYEAGSHKLCAIAACPVASPALNRAIERIRAALPSLPRFSTAVELFTNESDVRIQAADTIPRAARAFFDTLGVTAAIEYDGFRVSRDSFFQVNRFLAARLVELATGGERGRTALDLYAGVGLFTAPLARAFDEVTAVEEGGSAFRDLGFNMARFGLPVRTVRAGAGDFLSSCDAHPDFILADPPRAGLGELAIGGILRLRPPRLTIVSCDPATLARDLLALSRGGYRILKLTLADLFPHTYHLETIAQLEAG